MKLYTKYSFINESSCGAITVNMYILLNVFLVLIYINQVSKFIIRTYIMRTPWITLHILYYNASLLPSFLMLVLQNWKGIHDKFVDSWYTYMYIFTKFIYWFVDICPAVKQLCYCPDTVRHSHTYQMKDLFRIQWNLSDPDSQVPSLYIKNVCNWESTFICF